MLMVTPVVAEAMTIMLMISRLIYHSRIRCTYSSDTPSSTGGFFDQYCTSATITAPQLLLLHNHNNCWWPLQQPAHYCIASYCIRLIVISSCLLHSPHVFLALVVPPFCAHSVVLMHFSYSVQSFFLFFCFYTYVIKINSKSTHVVTDIESVCVASDAAVILYCKVLSIIKNVFSEMND